MSIGHVYYPGTLGISVGRVVAVREEHGTSSPPTVRHSNKDGLASAASACARRHGPLGISNWSSSSMLRISLWKLTLAPIPLVCAHQVRIVYKGNERGGSRHGAVYTTTVRITSRRLRLRPSSPSCWSGSRQRRRRRLCRGGSRLWSLRTLSRALAVR